MSLMDSIAVLVTAGAVAASATSLYAVFRGPRGSQSRHSPTRTAQPKPVPSADTVVNKDVPVIQPTVFARCKPALMRVGRLCYRTTVTFLPAFTAVGAAWLLLNNPDTFTRAVPGWCISYGARIANVVPLHPNNVLQAFDLGVAAQLLESGRVSAALERAAAVAGRVVSEDELRMARQLVEELASHRGLAERVWSSFTLINAIWLISTCGLAWVSCPFIIVVLRPLLRRIPWEAVVQCIRRLATRCFPLVTPALFWAGFACAVESARYVGTDTLSGTMLSFTGMLLFNAGMVNSLSMAIARWGRGDGSRAVSTCWAMLNAAYLAPQAILHQSTLLGYVTMGSVAAGMGLMAAAYPWGMLIGFRSRADLLSTAIGCGSLTWAYLLLSAMQVHPACLAPFESAVGVIGTTGYLLALDIQALLTGTVRGYALYGLNVGIYFAAGELLGLEGLSNVAKTFTGIGLFTLYCGHFPKRHTDAVIVWLFLLFASLYGTCLYLNRNPQLVRALFGGAPFLHMAQGGAAA